ncbi:Protein of unknown function DUF900, hydrolase-like [Rhabdaerophilaceae bacterium]
MHEMLLFPLKPLLYLALFMSISGCASKPEPALKLAAPAAGAFPVKVLVATTRRPSNDPAVLFSGERSLSPRLAHVTISVPKDRDAGEIIWPQGGQPDASRTFAATSFAAVPQEGNRKAIGEAIRMTGRDHVLVFVHGYNTRFDEAAFRIAQIVHDAHAPVTPVLFSWPSWGTLSAYPYDRESAATARDGLEAVLMDLASDPAVKQVSVLAHSMGGWLTLEALRQMAIRNKKIAPKIKDVMLAAPDVDVDVAMAQGRAILAASPRPRLTLFVSSDDQALNVSRLVWGSRDRLGSFDPSKEPYRTNLAKNGVEVFDLTGQKGISGEFNHNKFATAPAIVGLIGQRLASGQRLHGDPTIGESAGSFAQGAVNVVGGVVTAPLRIVSGSSEPDAERAAIAE